jgi:hypothetical protein
MGLLVGVLTALTVGPTMLFALSPYDGGLVASGGTFISHGQLPYRDFWWLYGPLGPFLMAIASSIAGPTVLLVRLLGLLAIAVAAALAYVIVARRAVLVLALALIVGGSTSAAFVLGCDLTAWSLAIPLVLAAFVLIDRGRIATAGLFLGLAFLARLDVGAYGLLAALAVMPRIRLLAGFAAAALPIAGFEGLTTPLADLIQQVIWFPLFGTRIYRAVPAPGFGDFFDFLLFLTLVLGPKIGIGLAAIAALRRREAPGAIVALILFGALTQLQTVGRADYYHQATAAFIGFAILAMAWTPPRRQDPPAPGPAHVLNLATFALVTVLALSSMLFGSLSWLRIERGAVSPAEANLVAAIRTVKANTTTTEPIFVGLTSHRFTILNAMLVYYLADRPAGTWGTMFNPGITNTEPAQRRMVDELDRHGTRLLVLDDHNAEAFEITNESATPGSTVLDEYIAASYHVVCRFGTFAVLQRAEDRTEIGCASPVPESIWDVITRRY